MKTLKQLIRHKREWDAKYRLITSLNIMADTDKEGFIEIRKEEDLLKALELYFLITHKGIKFFNKEGTRRIEKPIGWAVRDFAKE